MTGLSVTWPTLAIPTTVELMSRFGDSMPVSADRVEHLTVRILKEMAAFLAVVGTSCVGRIARAIASNSRRAHS